MADQQQTSVLTVLLNGEQAKTELSDLQKKARELAKDIDDARKAGNHTFANQLTRDLKETNKAITALKRETVDVTKVLNNLSSAKPKELSQTLSILQKRLNNPAIKRNSIEWNELQNSIQRVREEMRKISAESSVAESRLSRLSNGFNKYFGMITAGIASLTGISFAMRQMINDAREWDKIYRSVADAGETTVDEVKAINENLKKINTTTLRQDLNALAETGLRLGESSYEITGYVTAVDKVNVVMGKSFGNVEEMAETLGKVRSQFQETKDMKAEEAYTKIASSLNILDKKGAGSAKNIAEFTMNIGSMQDTLKPTIADAMALGTVLEESGQEADKASRSYAIVVNTAAQNIDKFSKFMGMSREELENLINTQPVEFLKLLSGELKTLSGTKASQALKNLGIGANEAQKFLGALSNKTERLTELQYDSNDAFREGININESFAIKNEGIAATLEKSKKRVADLREELGNKLMPTYAKLHISSAKTLSFFIELPKWLKENKVTLLALIIVWGTYTAAINASIIADKLKVLWTGRITTAFKTMTATVKTNPWGLIATGAILAISWLNKYLNKQKEVNNEQKEFNKLAEKGKALFEESKPIEERANAMKMYSKVQLESLKSDLEQQLTARSDFDAEIKARGKAALNEDKKLSDLRKQLNNADTELEKNGIRTRISWRQQELTDELNLEYKKNKESIRSLNTHLKNVNELLKKIPKDNSNGDSFDEFDGKESEQKQNEIAEIDQQSALRRIAAMNDYNTQKIDKKKFEEEMQQIERDTIIAKRDSYTKGSNEYVKYQEELIKTDLKVTEDKEKIEKERQEKINSLIEKYNKAAAVTDEQKKQHELDLLNELFSEELRATEQYLKLKQAIEDDFDPVKKGNIEAAKQLVGDNPTPTSKKRDLRASLDDDSLSSGGKRTLIDTFEQTELAQLDALQSLKDAEIDSIINYEETRQNIEEKYRLLREENNKEEFERKIEIAKFGIEQLNTILSSYSSYVQACQDAETAKINKKYDVEIKAAGNNERKKKKIEENREKELSEAKAKTEDKSFKIQIAQALASTAMAALNAYASTVKIPIVGPTLAPIAAGVATAAGMLQVAAIQKQHEAAKAQYFTGGFTPSGPWNKYQGDVHSDEFVGNRFAVRNPVVNRMFSIVDQAQKNNTVSSLTEKDFAKALDYREAENQSMVSNFAGAIASSSPENDNNDKMFNILFEWFSRNTAVTEKLNQKLDEPIVAETYVTGRNGIKEAMDKYERMKSNVSRQ